MRKRGTGAILQPKIAQCKKQRRHQISRQRRKVFEWTMENTREQHPALPMDKRQNGQRLRDGTLPSRLKGRPGNDDSGWSRANPAERGNALEKATRHEGAARRLEDGRSMILAVGMYQCLSPLVRLIGQIRNLKWQNASVHVPYHTPSRGKP